MYKILAVSLMLITSVPAQALLEDRNTVNQLASSNANTSHQQQALALVQLLEIDEQIKYAKYQLHSRYAHQLKPYRIEATQRPLEDNYRKMAFDFADEQLSWSALQQELAAELTNQYSEDELRQLTAFFSHGVGQKFIQQQPAWQSAVNKTVNQKVQRIEQEFDQLVANFVSQANLQHYQPPQRPSHPQQRPIAPPSKSSHVGHSH